MKITSLQISNILSFKYFEDISSAPKITFENGLNILIGQNGAGKSTALEVINFVFKRVLLTQFDINQDLYSKKSTIPSNEKKGIVTRPNNQTYTGFRLEPNWNSPNESQKIKIEVSLDEIDKNNLATLEANKEKLHLITSTYSNDNISNFTPTQDLLTVEITLHKADKNFTLAFAPDNTDPGFLYLIKYNFYKELITLYNLEHPDDPIQPLYESFTLIGSYRNYHGFTPSVTLGATGAPQQIQSIRNNEFAKSTNANEQSEPAIFSLVRLRIADKHYSLYGVIEAKQAEEQANQEGFLAKINTKLKLVNLKIEVRLAKKQTWDYSFSFFDTARDKPLIDIDSLSAGQKSIIHLVFEAYGRGDLKGGLVIIDEPEIHLHYQFQNEYLRIIEEINKEQSCQYILVTHSEALINSKTIDKVKRFALNAENYTEIKSPGIQEDQKTLIKILDNTRSTYAFFARKVVLVEGDTDRYFFKAVFQELRPDLNQEIAILDIGGKGNYKKWSGFFSGFGLQVYYIGDFDNVFSAHLSERAIIERPQKEAAEDEAKQAKLDNLSQEAQASLRSAHEALLADHDFLTKPKRAPWKLLLDRFVGLVKIENQEIVQKIKETNQDIETKIEQKYAEKIYILKAGAVEQYIGTSHGELSEVIDFCRDQLAAWLQTDCTKAREIKTIVEKVSA